MALIRYAPVNPFEGFQSLQDTMNRFFAEPAANRPWVPAVDIRETENDLVLKADVPDMKFEDIDVRLENGTLTLRGERKFEAQKDEGGWHRVERSYGSFERVFTLPDTVNPEGVTADYKNGTLTVTLPKKEIAKPRQVKVQISNGSN
jgi:HSP20 family protein